MVKQNLLSGSNVSIKDSLGGMCIIEHAKDVSTVPLTAKAEYFAAKMNINRRQLLINLADDGYTIQAGAMQWMSGKVAATTGVKGVGDFIGKLASSAVTKESAIKPEYVGTGQLMLEPTYRHIILTDVADWGGQVVLDDGLFLACDSRLKLKTVARSNISSAVFGKEGLFNLSLVGEGVVALESIVPKEELIEIELKDDVMKIDGNMAIAWSGSLSFTVEKAGKSLIGSAASGEGLVNVYRGTGKIWMAPVMASTFGAGVTNISENASLGRTGSAAGKRDIGGTVEKLAGVMDIFK